MNNCSKGNARLSQQQLSLIWHDHYDATDETSLKRISPTPIQTSRHTYIIVCTLYTWIYTCIQSSWE